MDRTARHIRVALAFRVGAPWMAMVFRRMADHVCEYGGGHFTPIHLHSGGRRIGPQHLHS
jgi:hypothetical protein